MMKTKSHILLILALSVSVLLAGCIGASQDDLQGTTWKLKEINGSIPIDGSVSTIEFIEGRISGSAGCNHFGGDYKVKGEEIEFESIYNTEMACMEPEGIMDQERVVLETLRAAVRFSRDEEELAVIDNADRHLIFDRYESNADDSSSGDQNDSIQMEAPTEVPNADATLHEDPPWEYNPYQDPETGIAIFIPDRWIVTGIVEGEYAILQSYPEDKYVGGEPLAEGDAKCDLQIHPAGINAEELIEQWKSSPMTTIVSEGPFRYSSGQLGTRFEIESLGPSVAVVGELGRRAVVLTCFGDFSQVDEIAATLNIMD